MLNILNSATGYSYGPPRKPTVPRPERSDGRRVRPQSVQSSKRVTCEVPSEVAASNSVQRPLTARAEFASSNPLPLIGASPLAGLPTERAGARKLHATLQAAFERAGPVGYKAGGAISAAQLADEWRMLSMVMAHLVKQMAPKMVEWSSVLELLRTSLSRTTDN